MEFGKLFREHRTIAGYTQKQLAEYLQIHQSNISDWENDISRPEYENLIKLARLYQITLDELLGVDER
ncbi:MAG: helix-turn-helix domain-containing protein [Clostridiales bacterium]|jgi:transcriptional regulator with XRE-family HTH domain|nr:helix-turn-helix domain-containing protein [Clostridiales bacterium]